MNVFKKIKDGMNNVELRPKAAFSFSTRNKATGAESSEKGIKFSFSVTLWHLVWIVLIAVSVLQTLSALRGAFQEKKIRQKVMRELAEKEKKAREKENAPE